MQPHSTRAPYFPENLQDYAPWVAKHGLVAPYGECQCGCGKNTSLTDRTSVKTGYRKGDPYRFLNGHVNGAKQSIEDAFWRYVTPGGFDECWLWQGDIWNRSRGYGRLRFAASGQRGQKTAHRVSYELHYGPIPNGLHVCHHCDNPSCVNPYHLFLGTDADNMIDMRAKGRDRFVNGESHPNAKLNNISVAEIRLLKGTGLRQQDIGKRYGVSKSTIGGIWRGETWRK